MNIGIPARRLLPLGLLPAAPLLVVSGHWFALGGWLLLGTAPLLWRRWPAGCRMLTLWGLAGWGLMEAFEPVRYWLDGLTQAALMLTMFVVFVVPAFVLWALGWDGTW